MSFKSTILAAAAEWAVTGGAFMVIYNRGDAEDRLIGASSDAAEKVELHTHKEDANGVMRMVHVEEGFDLPANGQIVMERGGHHVMFLGLKEPMKQGDVIDLVLTFEKAGDVPVQVEVDLERMPQPGAHGGMNHGGMNHGTMKKN